MDDIPDWLWHWMALKTIEKSYSWFWNTYGNLWYQTADYELLRLYVWYLVMLYAIHDVITAPDSQEEIKPASNYNVGMEAIGEVSLSLMPKIDPFASIRSNIFNSFNKPVLGASAMNNILDSFNRRSVSASAMNNILDSFNKPALRYVPPKMYFTNGFSRFMPAGINFKPPKFDVSSSGFRTGN